MPTAIARRRGWPYDPDRLVLFRTLHAALRDHPPLTRLAPARAPEGNATLAFYEAYFSNFIKGTEFAVEEAADFVFRGVIPKERPQDAHDVLGTWRIVSDARKMTRTPADAAAPERLLKTRHAAMPMKLNTIDPNIKTLEDYLNIEDHKIALPSMKVSGQARTLQMAAAKLWGAGQLRQARPRTVSMKHLPRPCWRAASR